MSIIALNDANGVYGLKLQGNGEEGSQVELVTRPDYVTAALRENPQLCIAFQPPTQSGMGVGNTVEHFMHTQLVGLACSRLGGTIKEDLRKRLHRELCATLRPHYQDTVPAALLRLMRRFPFPVRAYIARAYDVNGSNAVSAFEEFPVVAIAVYCRLVWQPAWMEAGEVADRRLHAAQMIREGEPFADVASHLGIDPAYQAIVPQDSLIWTANASLFDELQEHLPRRPGLRSVWIRSVVALAEFGLPFARTMAEESSTLGDRPQVIRQRVRAIQTWLSSSRQACGEPVALDNQHVVVPLEVPAHLQAYAGLPISELLSAACEWHQTQLDEVGESDHEQPGLPGLAHLVPPLGPATGTSRPKRT